MGINELNQNKVLSYFGFGVRTHTQPCKRIFKHAYASLAQNLQNTHFDQINYIHEFKSTRSTMETPKTKQNYIMVRLTS